MEALEPEELAVWRVLAHADPNAKLSAAETAAIASATGGCRVTTDVAAEVLKQMVRQGHAYRSGVRATGQRTEQVYWLTRAGKDRAIRVLNR